MVSTVQVASIGLATLEILLIYKLSRYPGVTGNYAASIVGYNFISAVTLHSFITPSFSLYSEPFTPFVILTGFLGLTAITVDGLMPPVEDPRLDQAVKYLVKLGMVLAVVSVLLLVFPESVASQHQL